VSSSLMATSPSSRNTVVGVSIIRTALQSGVLDPEVGSAKSTVAAVAGSCSDDVAASAAAQHRAKVRCLREAINGWSPARHHLHHRGVRVAVHTLLLVAERLERDGEEAAAQRTNSSSSRRRRTKQSSGGGGGSGAVGPIDDDAAPILPPELWRVVAAFICRCHFTAPPLPSPHLPTLSSLGPIKE
jgi:hypothetical protein